MLRKRFLLILLVPFWVLPAVNASTQKAVPDKSKQKITETATRAEQKIAPGKTEKIDKVGDRLDRIGETASSYFG